MPSGQFRKKGSFWRFTYWKYYSNTSIIWRLTYKRKNKKFLTFDFTKEI